MRVREILLELAEVLDRHQYGSWIDSNTKKIHPVGREEHLDFIKAHQDYFRPDQVKKYNSQMNNMYHAAFEKGYVRIEHSRPGELNVQGNGADIAKIAPMIIASIVQPDMEEVNIEKDDKGQYQGYGLPEDRREATQYIRAG